MKSMASGFLLATLVVVMLLSVDMANGYSVSSCLYCPSSLYCNYCAKSNNAWCTSDPDWSIGTSLVCCVASGNSATYRNCPGRSGSSSGRRDCCSFNMTSLAVGIGVGVVVAIALIIAAIIFIRRRRQARENGGFVTTEVVYEQAPVMVQQQQYGAVQQPAYVQPGYPAQVGYQAVPPQNPYASY